MAGYWLDCSQGREASETWTDPRGGILVGAATTMSRGRASFEFARIAEQHQIAVHKLWVSAGPVPSSVAALPELPTRATVSPGAMCRSIADSASRSALG